MNTLEKEYCEGDSCYPYYFKGGLEYFIDGLCDMLEDDNPHFDRERFITACK